MKILRVILGDQLSETISSSKDIQPDSDVILMAEVRQEAQYVKHHKKKIVLIFSAMRHFANSLKKKGYTLEYTQYDDSENAGSITGEVSRAIKKYGIEKIVITEPGEYRVLKGIQSWQSKFNIPVEIREDDRFLCSINDFKEWAKNKKQCRMEFFYRKMRQDYGILMHDNKPEGGKWNYDAENRKPPTASLNIPKPYCSAPDDITQEVIKLAKKNFSSHFGDIEPFHFAVTREDALKALNYFISEKLPHFGAYQDAMLESEPWMYHSHISFYLNIGLLLPLECALAAENAYYQKKAPLNAVEGFIRQIIGWREYVRGIYWLAMPNYAKQNYLNATNTLPEFFWTADTKLNCMKQCIQETKHNAYAHHIQRLMVIGNFCLLTGMSPVEVNEWYLIVYADAFEWVELPNVTGMILFADGGYLASKPYAASGTYIKKMSNYCDNCRYNVNKKNGEDACPFNYLYWNFMAKNHQKLSKNPRLRMVYNTYAKMTDEKKTLIAEDSKRFIDSLK